MNRSIFFKIQIMRTNDLILTKKELGKCFSIMWFACSTLKILMVDVQSMKNVDTFLPTLLDQIEILWTISCSPETIETLWD